MSTDAAYTDEDVRRTVAALVSVIKQTNAGGASPVDDSQVRHRARRSRRAARARRPRWDSR